MLCCLALESGQCWFSPIGHSRGLVAPIQAWLKHRQGEKQTHSPGPGLPTEGAPLPRASTEGGGGGAPVVHVMPSRELGAKVETSPVPPESTQLPSPVTPPRTRGAGAGVATESWSALGGSRTARDQALTAAKQREPAELGDGGAAEEKPKGETVGSVAPGGGSR